MEEIYKGTYYVTTLPSDLAFKGARLFNPASKFFIEFSTKTSPDSIRLFLSPAMTSSMPEGVYNLEVYTSIMDEVQISEYRTNFAVVKDSSFNYSV